MDAEAAGPTAETRWADAATVVRILARHFARLESLFPLEPSASGATIFSQDERLKPSMGDDGAESSRTGHSG